MQRRRFLETAALAAGLPRVPGLAAGDPSSTALPAPKPEATPVAKAPSAAPVLPGRLYAGWASREITPPHSVALSGQFHKRISTRVESPLFATALALETRDGDTPLDQAILVSCDLVGIAATLQQRLRELLKDKLPSFDLNKLVLNATHTHTAPVTGESWYEVTEPGVMKPDEYVAFLLDRLSEAVAEAWSRRAPGGVNWGLGYATVGYNRRMVYADGHAVMYGRNDTPDFVRVEGYEDSTVECLFVWDTTNQVSGVAVNVPCPSQVQEMEEFVSADFWHEVRAVLRRRFARDLFVLPWTSAAGDISPHPQIRRAAAERMRKLRAAIPETRDIALRIAYAVDYAYGAVKSEILRQVPFAHRVEQLDLPAWKISDEEYRAAKAVRDRITAKPRAEWGREDYARLQWHQEVLDRYEHAAARAVFPVELHVMRLGDAAIATNPFELFLDYGIEMKTRSKALQTFLIQLATGEGGYLPTEKAAAGGGYSAVPESCPVGPPGGKRLVERTLEIINSFWS